ncbi:hypothetical protein B0I27_11273 [Arcticibacter pallidicorallinus]|uniref:Lipoprotein n=1 Tax=Arcticibacter pallidicorallinus TaxID=1259464 RepID=A0A2T0TUI8_9SPHI|nr:hypothetical protein [Arcticibacter pallidicorallinus]PRY49188.1 hypothetical protein B0I27_11273 [Arcticibacter pallidicorallinus]
MKHYLIGLAMLALLYTSCSSSSQNKEEDATLKELVTLKRDIDNMMSDSTLQVLVKVKGKRELQVVKDRGYPRNIETTYNLLRDTTGRVLFISEMPYNATSEWFIAYKSYFDADGRLFAFQRQNNFLNNGCTHGAAMENSIGYYNEEFLLIDSVYTITDTYKKPLDKKVCKFPYNFKYTIIKTLNEYIAAKNITLASLDESSGVSIAEGAER